MTIYRSRFAQYWHFLILRSLDAIYAYSPNNRKVSLSYCHDESGRVLLCTPLGTKKKHFAQDRELSESELQKITMVYEYKPYDQTIERLVASRQW